MTMRAVLAGRASGVPGHQYDDGEQFDECDDAADDDDGGRAGHGGYVPRPNGNGGCVTVIVDPSACRYRACKVGMVRARYRR